MHLVFPHERVLKLLEARERRYHLLKLVDDRSHLSYINNFWWGPERNCSIMILKSHASKYNCLEPVTGTQRRISTTPKSKFHLQLIDLFHRSLNAEPFRYLYSTIACKYLFLIISCNMLVYIYIYTYKISSAYGANS